MHPKYFFKNTPEKKTGRLSNRTPEQVSFRIALSSTFKLASYKNGLKIKMDRSFLLGSDSSKLICRGKSDSCNVRKYRKHVNKQ